MSIAEDREEFELERERNRSRNWRLILVADDGSEELQTCQDMNVREVRDRARQIIEATGSKSIIVIPSIG